MKTIGMLGGMSWESTATYYRLINEGIKDKLGGLHSAKICLYSVDFSELEGFLREDNWDAIIGILKSAAQSVESGGADFLMICTNTMHKVISEIEEFISIPVLHIADAAAEVLIERKIRKTGLLGTRFTMEQDFYKGRLAEKYGLDVIVPNAEDRDIVDQVIFDELCLGKVESASREQYLRIIDSLHKQGAEAIILGCTEIALLVQPKHTRVPLLDTTETHAKKAVEMALS